MLRVLICGSRKWADYRHVYLVLKEMRDEIDMVISGGAPGADTLAREAAEALSLSFTEFMADWQEHGKAAGPFRNQKMLDIGKPDLVIAFHEDPALGKGTADMVRRSLKAGVPVRIFPPRRKNGRNG